MNWQPASPTNKWGEKTGDPVAFLNGSVCVRNPIELSIENEAEIFGLVSPRNWFISDSNLGDLGQNSALMEENGLGFFRVDFQSPEFEPHDRFIKLFLKSNMNMVYVLS